MDELRHWLTNYGLVKYHALFREQAIDLDVLEDLDRQDFRDLGLPIGDVHRLLRAVADWKQKDPRAHAHARGVDLDGTGLDATAGAELRQPAPETSTWSRPRDGAERRQLTVMFADLAGSTELSQRLDPEDLRDLNRAYQDVVTRAVQQAGGFVARYMGDGVLAYFGYPAAHEDDAERAIRAGLTLTRSVPAIQSPETLAVRVGIATGPVVVGDLIGEGEAQERAVVGETPNLAARLQGLAQPNSVIVAATTRRLAGRLFEYESLGHQPLKGIADPVPVWTVRGESEVRSRFEARGGSDDAPLQGRRAELDLLLASWAGVGDGTGALAYISGEPGIGKSFFTQHLIRAVQSGAATVVQWFCSPSHGDSAFYPVTRYLFDTLKLASVERTEDRIERLLAFGADRRLADEHLGALAALLGIEANGSADPGSAPWPRVASEVLHSRTLEALVEVVCSMARDEPLALILEDAQWLDPSTTELLDGLIERLPAVRVMLVMTSRPEFSPRWDPPGTFHLSLSRLQRPGALAIIERVAGERPLPGELVEHILDRTDGIPLFVEELTKSVIESGLLDEVTGELDGNGSLLRARVPVTLHDSLMARLDRLGKVKEVAQVGSVIGRSFDRELLALVCPCGDEELTAALRRLVEAELIHAHDNQPAELDGGTPGSAGETSAHQSPSTAAAGRWVSFTFKHAMVQDAAYGSLLNRRREEIHRAIADALSRSASEEVALQPEVLARHYAEGRMVREAVAAWLAAGRRAAGQSANAEATAHLQAALELLKELPEDDGRAALELECLLAISVPLAGAQFWNSEEAIAVSARAEALCQALDRKSAMRQVLFGKYTRSIIGGQLQDASTCAQQLLQLGNELNSSSTLMNAYRWFCWPAFYRGEFEQVEANLERSFELHDPSLRGAAHGRAIVDAEVEALCIRSLLRWMTGQPERASKDSEDSVALANRLGHPTGRAYALSLAGLLAGDRQDWEAAGSLVESLRPLTSELRAPVFTAWCEITERYRHAGCDPSVAGIRALEEAIERYLGNGGRAFITMFYGWVADLYLRLEAFEQASRALGHAFQFAEDIEERFYTRTLRALKVRHEQLASADSLVNRSN